MNQINIEKKNLVPEGDVYIVQVGCRTYMSTDCAFVAKWVGDYIAEPEDTRKNWDNQPWNEGKKEYAIDEEVLAVGRPTVQRERR